MSPEIETLGTKDLASLIDHTLLRPDANLEQILQLCREAIEHGFYAVCVNSRWLPVVANELKGHKSLPISVVGFPLGANLTAAKVFETQKAREAGAREIDMVIDLGAVKSKNWLEVELDIRAVVNAAQNAPVKVILETALLSEEDIVRACRVSIEGGAAFVKTSTGFGPAGANARHVQLMREVVGPDFGVKASGGVRDLETFRQMLAAGANRVGSSNSVKILSEASQELSV
jgi:deoxyribose-phosphate aldolase